MDYRQFSVAHATRLLDRLAFQMNAAARSHTPEVVHDLRVAVRRFSQALAIGKPCFPARGVKKMRRRVKAVMSRAGAVRDCDIALKLVSGSKAADAGAIEAKLRARSAEGRKILAASLGRFTSGSLVSKWSRILQECATAAPIQTTVEDVARRKLVRLAATFLREGQRAAARKASATQMHHVRLAAKKLRYTLELFSEVYGEAAADWVEQLRQMQILLGRISDCSVTRRLVEEMGGSAEMVAALESRQKRKAREFRRAWKEGAERVNDCIHAFERPPHKPLGRAALERAAARGSASA